MFEGLTFFRPVSIRKNYNVARDEIVDGDRMTKDLRAYIEERFNHGDDEEVQAEKEKRLKQIMFRMVMKSSAWRSADLPEVIAGVDMLIIMLTLQANIVDMISFLDLVLEYGGFIVCVCYIIISVFVGMPLFIIYFTLGAYSKQKYMEFWSAMPIMKGTAIAILVHNVLFIVMHMYLCTLSAVFWWDAIWNPMFFHCGYPGANASNCLTPRSTENKSITCSDGHPLQFGVYSYVENILYDGDKDAPLNVTWWVLKYAIIPWFLLYILTICSRVVFKLVYKSIICYWLIFMWPIMVVLISSLDTSSFKPWNQSISYFGKINMWKLVTLIVTKRLVPGDLITYATLAKPNHNPTMQTVLTLTSAGLVFFLAGNRVTVGSMVIMSAYNTPDKNCFKYDGMGAFFSIVPEQNLIIRQGWYMIIYYFVSMYYCFLVAYFSTVSMADTIHKSSFRMVPFKKAIVTLTIMLSVVMSIPLYTNKGAVIVKILREMELPFLLLLSYSAIFIAFYKPSRIMNDYHFLYGYRLSNYWVLNTKFVVQFLLLLSFGSVTYLCISQDDSDLLTRLISITVTLLMFIPVLLNAATNYINYRHKLQRYLFKPEASWGKSSKSERDARRRFNPKRECKIKTLMKCEHDCLRDSLCFLEVEAYWRRRMMFFCDKYHIKRAPKCRLPHWPEHLEPMKKLSTWVENMPTTIEEYKEYVHLMSKNDDEVELLWEDVVRKAPKKKALSLASLMKN